MHFDGDEEETYSVETFSKILAETAVQCWFERYGFPQEYFEVTVIAVLEDTKLILGDIENQDWRITGLDPAELARRLVNRDILERAHEKHHLGPIVMEEMEAAGVNILLCFVRAFIRMKQIEQ